MLLEGRVIVVSGVGPGVGRAVALGAAREGAHVVLGARTEERLREVAAEVEGLGRKAVWRVTDIRDEEQCRSLAGTAAETFGGINALVNNAFWHGPMGRFDDATPDMWRKAFDVNVVGSLAMTNAVLPAMKERGRGSVVFVNSLAARQGWQEEAAYAASKAALLNAARALARAHGPDGVRVNSVLPGPIMGPSLEYWFGHLAEQRGVTPQDVYDEWADETCLRHIPTSEEVADAVLFLCSDLSAAITGQALHVNAGQFLG